MIDANNVNPDLQHKCRSADLNKSADLHLRCSSLVTSIVPSTKFFQVILLASINVSMEQHSSYKGKMTNCRCSGKLCIDIVLFHKSFNAQKHDK